MNGVKGREESVLLCFFGPSRPEGLNEWRRETTRRFLTSLIRGGGGEMVRDGLKESSLRQGLSDSVRL